MRHAYKLSTKTKVCPLTSLDWRVRSRTWKAPDQLLSRSHHTLLVYFQNQVEPRSNATQQTLLIIYVGEGEGDEKKVVSHSGINLHSEKLRRYLLLEITYHQLETNPLATCLSTPQTLEFMADPYTHGIHYQEIFPTTEETIYSSDLESTEWCHMVTNGKHCISSRLLRCWLVTQLFSQQAN